MARLFYNRELKAHSRDLRNRMTDAERRFWSKVRGKQLRGCQFYRQRIVGNYIVDFYCPPARLVIELDGSQHYAEEGLRADTARDSYLEGQGLKVLRFSDVEVLKNLPGVMERVWEAL